MQVSQVADLDDADRKILRELQRDARVSFKTIAQKAGVSEATIFVRVKKMQEKGVIQNFTAIVNPTAVGIGYASEVWVNSKEWISGMLSGCDYL